MEKSGKNDSEISCDIIGDNIDLNSQMSIQNIVGPARDWPFLIRRLFWTKNMRHFQRILIATFVYVNGLNPVIFMEWADQLNLARGKESIRGTFQGS